MKCFSPPEEKDLWILYLNTIGWVDDYVVVWIVCMAKRAVMFATDQWCSSLYV